MYISLHKRVIFFHIPKTAGISITNAFEKFIQRDPELNIWVNLYYDVTKDPAGCNSRNGKRQLPYHVTQPALKVFLDYIGQRVDNFFEFVVVRHPYDRLISLVKYSGTNNSEIVSVDTLLDAVENNSKGFAQSQLEWIDSPLTKKLHIYKYEEFSENGWNDIRNKLNLDLPDLPRLNVSPLRDIVLTKEQKSRCYKLLPRDFDELGYEP